MILKAHSDRWSQLIVGGKACLFGQHRALQLMSGGRVKKAVLRHIVIVNSSYFRRLTAASCNELLALFGTADGRYIPH